MKRFLLIVSLISLLSPLKVNAQSLSDWESVSELEQFLEDDYNNHVAARFQWIDGDEAHLRLFPTCVDYSRGLLGRAEKQGKRLTPEIIEDGQHNGLEVQKGCHMLCKAIVGERLYLVEAQNNMAWYWRELYR